MLGDAKIENAVATRFCQMFAREIRVKRLSTPWMVVAFGSVLSGQSPANADIVFEADADSASILEWADGDDGQGQMCAGPLCGTPGSYAYLTQDTARGGPSAPRAGSHFLRLSRTATQPPSQFSGGVTGNRVIVQNQTATMMLQRQEYWVGFSLWVPASFDTAVVFPESSGGWNFLAGTHAHNPQPTYLYIALVPDNRLIIRSRTYAGDCCAPDIGPNFWEAGPESATGTTHYSGSMPRGQWVDFVFNLVSDERPRNAGGIGKLHVWINGTKQVEYSGPIGYKSRGVESGYWYLGNYAHDENVHDRTYYYDEFRFGANGSSYSEVAPGGGGTRPNPPAFTAIQ
jgi:hypothetical protein